MKSLSAPKSIEVDIELSDPVPTDAEIEADFKGLMNMKELSLNTANQLRRVGMHVKRQGVVETERGALFVTQGWVLAMCADLYRMAQAKTVSKDGTGKDVDSTEVCKIAECLRKLAGAQAELSTVMLSHEPVAANGNGAPPAPTASFPAGAMVFGQNAQAHFHQTPPPPPEKTVAKPPDGA